MTTRPSYESVTDYHILFDAHPDGHDVHLNTAYFGDLPNRDSLWQDAAPGGYGTLLDDTPLLNELRRLISHEFILPFATETHDVNEIVPVINRLAISVMVGGRQRRFNQNGLYEALEEARLASSNEIQIYIKTNGMYFDERDGKLSYMDWSKIGHAPFTTPAAVPSGATAPTPTTLTPSTIGIDPAAIAMLGSSIVSGIASLGLSGAAAPSGTGAPAPAPASITSSMAATIFNINGLPSDVQLRYKNKVAKKLITGTTVSTPYSLADSGGHRWHLDGADRLILADGTLFILNQTPTEKALVKADICCRDESHAGLRTWIDRILVPTCMMYGVYVHPFWCYRKDKGGARGFVCGDDVDDDIPLRMKQSLEETAPVLYRILQRRDMFGKDSRLPAIIQSSPGDGYAALKAILRKAHPVFYEEPATLVKRYPMQKNDQSLREYYKLFKDFLQCRAFVLNVDSDLDEPAEVMIFIDNAKHSLHLRRCTRDERRQRALQHRYQGEQLVETLEEFLMAADSPVWEDSKKKSPMKGYGERAPSCRPFQIRKPLKTLPVNQIGFSNNDLDNFFNSDDEEEAKDSGRVASINAISSDKNDLHPIEKAVYNIAVPEDHESLHAFHVYATSVSKIVANPQEAFTSSCIVCEGKHDFARCPVLNNYDFLRSHYVRLCQMLRRDESAKTGTKSPGKKASPCLQGIKPVNFIDSGNHQSDEHSSADSDDDASQDFQTGRVG